MRACSKTSFWGFVSWIHVLHDIINVPHDIINVPHDMYPRCADISWGTCMSWMQIRYRGYIYDIVGANSISWVHFDIVGTDAKMSWIHVLHDIINVPHDMYPRCADISWGTCMSWVQIRYRGYIYDIVGNMRMSWVHFRYRGYIC